MILQLSKIKPMNFNGVNVPLAKTNDAKAFTVREQLLQNPDNTIGDPIAKMFERYLFMKEDMKMFFERIFTSVGLETIWKEIVANGADNVSASRRRGNFDVGSLDFNYMFFEDGSVMFSIVNYGDPFPIEMVQNDVKKIMQLRPVMLFQEENSSTNYSKNRTGSGKNGIGAKATNIMSKYFKVEILNAESHLAFTGEWKDNKNPIYTEDDKHYTVTDYFGKESMTKVSFIPDLVRFGLTTVSPEIIKSLEAYMINFSFANKIPVRINADTYDFSDVTAFSNLYFTNSVFPDVIFREYPMKKKVYNAWDPSIEFLARYTPGSSVQISFVNGLYTKKGGSHVNAVYDAISSILVETINEKTIKELKKEIIKKKRKETGVKLTTKITEEEYEKTKVPAALLKNRTVTNKDIMKHVSVVINIQVDNPSFIGQTKDVFANEIKINLDSASEKIIKDKWPLKKILDAELKSKVTASDIKDISKVKYENKFENPNNWKKTKGLMAYVVEGNSAAGYARRLIDCHPSGKDYIGICILKGVPLNVTTATRKQLTENSEFLSIVNNINLRLDIPQDQMDTYYLDDKNFKTLHYDKLIILTDSDTDGLHIRGLIILMFFTYWRSLIARGFLQVWLTPYLKVDTGRELLNFYTSNEWYRWLGEYNIAYNQGIVKVPVTKFHYRWLKGLGSSERVDVNEDYKLNMSIIYEYDSNTPEKMLLAFDKKYANQRKDWLRVYVDVNNVEVYSQHVTLKNINDFLDQEYTLFGREANTRTIRRIYDGLSSAQRKLLYYLFKKFGIVSTKKKDYDPIGTDKFVNAAAAETNYHHGSKSLEGVASGMAEYYIGSGNVQLLKDVGDFGTRYGGGEDCADARYTKLCPTPLVAKLFRSEDLHVLEYKQEEGNSIEPITYIPLIAFVLVNGTDVMGSGWSSKIPCFNPFELIQYVKMMLNGEHKQIPRRMVPWYFGYQGEIKIVDRKTRDEVSAEIDKDDDSKYSLIYYGKYSVDSSRNIHVTELPIGISGGAYRKKLESWKKDDIIDDFDDKCTVDMVYFIIEGYKGNLSYKDLWLTKSVGYGNFTCLDKDDNPVPISDTKTILIEHFNARMYFYVLRQQYDMAQIEKKILREEQRKKIVELFLAGELQLGNTTKKLQEAVLVKYSIEYKILDDMKSSMFNNEGYQSIVESIAKLNQELQIIIDRDNKEVYLSELAELEAELTKFYSEHITLYNETFQNSLLGKEDKKKEMKKGRK